ncbi:MAG: HNH endonuclease [Candidatus Symbiothrix sp.]|jgi:uncharacterized protein (TIGR02646 family)|nr:HNH endonuclease [Candidatus Symbiothrix sp.]
MIKYNLPQKPKKLTKELQEQLTQKFKDTGEIVWKAEWLKKAIADKSFGKCCYSDIKLGEESKYMEVDHFLPKSQYADLVLEWSNLNPSCKTCNASKGDHDSKKESIVNPFQDNPKDYLYLKAYRYYGKDDKGIGKKTIEVLKLNNNEQFVDKRADIGNEVKYQLHFLYKNCDLFFQPERLLLENLENLMQRGNRKEEYAALVSTVILEDNNFKNIETYLKENNLWDEELESLKSELAFCALPNL